MEKEDFWQAKEACDTRAMADFLVEKKENLLAEDVPMEASPLASKDVLLFMGRYRLRRSESVSFGLMTITVKGMHLFS